jgi:hypothetical protein
VRRLNQAEAARHVLDLLNEDPASFSEPAQERSEEKPPETDQKKLASILALWRECRDPHGTIVERYLREHRKVELPDNAAEVIRYHPNCFFDGKRRERCMVALIRNIKTNAPQGIHRTALTPDGKEQRDATTGKTRRLSWGHVNMARSSSPRTNISAYALALVKGPRAHSRFGASANSVSRQFGL